MPTIADARRAALYLSCPRCGLSLEVRSRWLTIRHCPRCVARSRTVVELLSSAVPADVVHASDLPPAHAETRTTLPTPGDSR